MKLNLEVGLLGEASVRSLMNTNIAPDSSMAVPCWEIVSERVNVELSTEYSQHQRQVQNEGTDFTVGIARLARLALLPVPAPCGFCNGEASRRRGESEDSSRYSVRAHRLS